MNQPATLSAAERRATAERNIALFQATLGRETDEARRKMIARLLVEAEREFAVASAEALGAGAWRPLAGPAASPALSRYRADFENRLVRSDKLYLLLDPGPGLRIVDASEAYAAATMTRRQELPGRALFEVFPDNTERGAAEGVANLYASLRTVAETGRPHSLPPHRYDVRDAQGVFVERYWQTVNSAVPDEDGLVIALLHHVEDVTAKVRGQEIRSAW